MAIAIQGALAAHAAPKRGARLSRLVILISALSLALTMFVGETSVAAASSASNEPQATKGSQAALIIKLARQALGHPFRMGAVGPKYFDCSGLVWSVYRRAGLGARVGGVRGTATHYYVWAQKHGRLIHNNPQIGDVVIWGMHGRIHHSGIYVGNGRAISALNPHFGVRDWPMSWIHMRIWGYVHTGITH